MLDCIALIVHPDRKDAVVCADRAEAFFRDKGLLTVRPQQGEQIQSGNSLIITFGGDGTLLLGAEYAIRYHIPLLGINLGTVGFLTEGEPDQLPELLDRLLKNDYTTESRTLLQVHINRQDSSFYALNDAVVTRGGFARLIRVDVFVNDDYLGTYTADGMIASTPTGSTAYALSAGGPVVDPSVKSMVLTPICAHSFQRASYLISDQAMIRFHLQENKKCSAELQIDGQSRATLKAGDTVYITGASQVLQLIRFKPYRFFTLTRKKLNEWTSADKWEEDNEKSEAGGHY